MEHLFLDETAAIISDESRELGRMNWGDLVEVSILTTSTGPLAEDFYFVLLAADGHRLTVPGGLQGSDALLERLQKLPGFDNEAFIRASSCTEDRTFLCWKKTI
jgi:hypothetical protein